MDFRYRLMRFMSGRNGPDELFFAFFILSVVLAAINVFLRSLIFQLIIYALVIYALFRVFSRNTEKRRSENSRFVAKAHFIKRKRELHEQRRNDKCHVYKKCPSCKAILKLPRRVGTHKTVCPKCGREFTVKVKK